MLAFPESPMVSTRCLTHSRRLWELGDMTVASAVLESLTPYRGPSSCWATPRCCSLSLCRAGCLCAGGTWRSRSGPADLGAYRSADDVTGGVQRPDRGMLPRCLHEPAAIGPFP